MPLAVAPLPAVSGLATFYELQTAAGQAALKKNGWDLNTDPCKWGTKSGISCSGNPLRVDQMWVSARTLAFAHCTHRAVQLPADGHECTAARRLLAL